MFQPDILFVITRFYVTYVTVEIEFLTRFWCKRTLFCVRNKAGSIKE